ncbi:hypothetical protein ABTK80_20000, partial [Acinetobacter baumannii]
LAAVAIGVTNTLMITPLYTATVRLQIDRNAVKIIEAGSTTPAEAGDADFLRTQYELLQSRAMAERVAAALRLADDAEFFRPRQFSPVDYIRSLTA